MRRAFFSLAIISGAVSASPAQAGGLLQDLFAQSQRPSTIVYHYAPVQPQMRFVYDEGLRVSRRRPSLAKKAVNDRSLAVGGRIVKKKAVAQNKQKARDRRLAHKSLETGASKATASLQTALCCKHGEDPSKLIHSDTTLRIGDAYMTAQGLRIYRGRNAGAAQAALFIDYRKAEIGQAMKTRLSAHEDQRMRAAKLAATSTPITSGLATVKTVPAVAIRQATPTRGPATTSIARTSVDPVGRIIRIVGP